ncbi:hypothetical protein C8R45DRAFT_1094593 [Mycena sanguinolenta]|nr:hypothetical protein C8R45DRAFT_1094593 [Mycena sanguinolenta]
MPTIAIFGATGTQGSAVLGAVLANGKYTPRAVSRNLESTASKALIAMGVEVVVGDLFDKDSLKSAIQGSDVVFGHVAGGSASKMTNFWDPDVFPAESDGKGEIVQGKNLVDAAKEVGVKFLIWSSLPSITKESKGLYTQVHHVENKAVIEDYLKASGIPHAVLLTGWFAENLWNYGFLQKTPNGYKISIPKFGPNDQQSFTWVAHDLGTAAVALLTNYPDSCKGVQGKAYPVVSFRATYVQLAAAVAKESGKEVTFSTMEKAFFEGPTTGYSEFQAKIGMYNDTPAPNPDLVALGVQFGTMEEFVKGEVVPRLG